MTARADRSQTFDGAVSIVVGTVQAKPRRLPTLSRFVSVVVNSFFAGLVAVAVAGTLWLGREWYLLDAEARLAHELGPVLSSGGSLGVALGLGGTLLMTLMMLYSLRKLVPRAQFLGALSKWLNFHIICGIGGPVLIILHTGLAWPRGLIAVGFWCMVAVALSGAFGRTVYGMLPRAAGGKALAWHDALERLADLRHELVASTANARPEAIGEAFALVRDFEGEARDVPELLTLARDLRRRRSMVAAALDEAGLDPAARRRAEDALFEQLRIKRGLEAMEVARRLFRYWHLFHRPLAGAMYSIVAIHIATAVLFGGSLSRLAELWGG